MADVNTGDSAARRQPNRLQRIAPASLQISPAAEWKAPIPLLSPLVQSPASDNPTVDIDSCSGSRKEAAVVAEKPVVVMKKWQHPAAPFSYDPAPFMPFVHTGFSDR